VLNRPARSASGDRCGFVAEAMNSIPLRRGYISPGLQTLHPSPKEICIKEISPLPSVQPMAYDQCCSRSDIESRYSYAPHHVKECDSFVRGGKMCLPGGRLLVYEVFSFSFLLFLFSLQRPSVIFSFFFYSYLFRVNFSSSTYLSFFF
jgi:hypothetical protein